MATGPCLCGDLYCPFCGNPAAAEMADEAEDFMAFLDEKVKTPDEYMLIKSLIEPLLEAYRKNIDTVINESKSDDGQYISFLEIERDRLKDQLKHLQNKGE